jgi:hypothetical protein
LQIVEHKSLYEIFIYESCQQPFLARTSISAKKINHQISGGPSNAIFRVKHRSMYAIPIWWWNTYLGFQEVECSQQDVYSYEYGGGVLVKFV